MPSSQPHQISKILNIIMAINPSSVLDVGVGFGKYGVLCREYLELWDGRENYHQFLHRVDGVEVFKEYLTPLHSFIYNNIYIGDIKTLVDSLDYRYDVVLLIDVLEHLTVPDGKQLIEKMLARHGGVLISTPKNIGHQKDAFHNTFETHTGQWTHKTLSKLGHYFFISDALNFIVYISAEEHISQLRNYRSRTRLEKLRCIISPYLSHLRRVLKHYHHPSHR